MFGAEIVENRFRTRDKKSVYLENLEKYKSETYKPLT